MVRSTASLALHVLRVLEEALIKSSAHNLIVRTRTEVALYILNQKRSHLGELEKRFGVQITVGADDTLQGTVYHALERGEPAVPPPDFAHKALVRVDSIPPQEPESEAETQAEAEPIEVATHTRPERSPAATQESEAESESEGEASRRRRRRRRRRGGRSTDRDGGPFVEPNAPQPSDAGLAAVAAIGGDIPAASMPVEAGFSDGESDELEAESFEVLPETEPGSETAENGEARRRRRSRRGGRNRHRETRPEGIAPVEVMPSGEWLPGLAQPQEPTDEIEAGSIMATAFGEVPPLTPAETAPAARPQDLTAEAQPTEPSAASAAAPAQTAAPGSPSPAEPPVPPAPTGPKRTGWWQRAKASFGGN
jgi:ribonuclease E